MVIPAASVAALSPVEVVDRGDDVARAPTRSEKIERTARWILEQFDAYYVESRHVPWLAKGAFERRDHARSIALSKRRLSMYSIAIESLGPRVKEAFPEVAEDEGVWDAIQAHHEPLIAGRYEADLAFAFFHSVRRRVYQGEWKPVEYSFSAIETPRREFPAEVVRTFPVEGWLEPATVAEILRIPGFVAPWRDLDEDAALVSSRASSVLARARARAVEVVDAGFFRNKGAYIVGRIVRDDERLVPFVIALLNEERGVYADALLMSEADAHNIFSSTLANFHVTNSHYHELSEFLHGIMPRRPVGLHYSTVGFNHVGKVAVMNELKEELASSGEVFATSVGFRGTVAIGFATPSSAYNLKVIRDRPTDGYKWGRFEGVPGVLRKYGQVHEINRTGSMLDNIIYYNLKLDRDWFDPELLDELCEQASESVSLRRDAVIFKHLIVQRRQTPLPVFLDTASRGDAEAAIVALGHCIKNNAAANIFNKDLDARNYGVSRFGKVYLYDYDALEPFTDVKIRTNADRVDGEEDVPDWVFEEGVVFLPEEIVVGLRIRDRGLRRLFREVHGDLLTVAWWERVQRDLLDGKVPGIRIYPEHCDLRRGASEHPCSAAGAVSP